MGLIQLRRSDVLATRGHAPTPHAPLVHVGFDSVLPLGTTRTGKMVEASNYQRVWSGVGVGLWGTAAYFCFKTGHWIWGSVFTLFAAWNVPTLVSGQAEDYTS